MAKENSKSFGSKKQIEVRVTNLPSGISDAAENIKEMLSVFKDSMSSATAAYVTGKAADGKTDKILQSKVQSQKKSILGDKDSIFALLSDLSKVAQAIKNINIESVKYNAAVSKLMDEHFDSPNALIDFISAIKDNSDNILSKIDPILNTYKESMQKLYKINEEIRKNNEKDIVEAKLKLMIEGIDTTTIDALIKFSELNFDKLDSNANNLINFFASLKILENIKFDDALKNLSFMAPLLMGLVGNFKIIKLVNYLITEKDTEAFSNLIGDKLVKVFDALNKISAVSKQSDAKSILKSFGVLYETLGLLAYSMPLFLIVNKSFASQNDKTGINLDKTGDIFIEIDNLFGLMNNIRTIDNGGKLIKSFMMFQIINNLLVGSLPNIILTNKLVNKNKLEQRSSNLKKIYELFGINLFGVINAMKTIDNGFKVYKSFLIFNTINKEMIHIFNHLSKIDQKNFDSDKLRAISMALNNMSIIFDIINKMKDLDGKTRQKIETIAGFFGESKGRGGKKINESLLHIFRNINRMVLPDTKTLDGINNSVNAIKTIIDSLNSINDITKDKDKIAGNIDDYLKLLEETYAKIQEKFNKIIAAGTTAENVKAANEKIADAMDSTNETIVKTSLNENNIKKSTIAIEGMTEFMIGAAVVMSIGALFVMLGGGKFIKAALKFGITLAVFEGLVLMPALMFGAQQENAMKHLEQFNTFVLTCAITMSIGAFIMWMSNGALVKNALAFGLVLSIFEMLVVSPILAFREIKDDVLKSVEQLTKFVTVCTIVMMVGALVVALGGGKFVKNALKFGLVLAEFELLIVAPLILFGLIKKDVMENAKGFSTLLITTTILLLIGSAFMALSGGKMVKYAMDFTIVLMKFEAMIIAPFLLFNLLRKQVFDGLKSFTSVVIVCTTVLLIGAIAMTLGGGKFMKNALEFTGVLALFEALIILPFLLFNNVDKQVMSGLKNFAIVVFVATTILIVGAMFMSINNGEMAKYALEFTGVLALFEALVVLPMLLFNLVKKEAIDGAKDFGMFVALCSFSLIIGAFFIANYGVEPIKQFAATFEWFIIIMAGAAVIMRFCNKEILEKAKDFGIFILLSSTALLTGALFVAKFGIEAPIKYAGLLVGFILLTGLAMVGISWAFKLAGGDVAVIGQMAALGSFLLMSTASIALGSWVIDKYGFKALAYAGLLIGFVGLMGVVFGILGLPPLAELIGIGATVAALMGVSLLLLTGSIILINLMFELDPGGKKILGNINILGKVLISLIVPYTLLGLLSVPIAVGAIVATAIGVSMFILGSSLSLINAFIGKNGTKLQKNIETLGILLLELGGVYTLLGLLSIPIALGSVAGVLLGVSITVIGGALKLVNDFINPIKDSILGNIAIMMGAIAEIGVLAGELILASIPMTLGLPGLALLNVFCAGITTSTLMMAKSVKAMNEIGDLSTSIDKIINNLQLFVDIPDKIEFGGPFGLGIIKKIAKVYAIKSLIQPLAYSMRTIGLTISELANLKVATKWDKDGNGIEWRQLSNNDFQSASANIATILTVMGQAFANTWNSIKTLYTGNDNAIKNTVSFSKEIGEVIKGIAGGVGMMAQLQVATAWDEKGNPISFRQLKDKDFDLTQRNVAKILITMADTFNKVWKGDIVDGNVRLKGLEDFLKDGDLDDMIEFSKSVGSVISGVAEGVGAMAKMQIPISWDPQTGKPTNFRTLKDSDFKLASDNVAIILTTVSNALINLGNRPEFNGNLFSDPKISGVIDIAFKMSELIGNIGSGIKDIAIMQIPTEWDPKTGKPTNYTKLKQSDFKAAGKSVGLIITALTDELMKSEHLKNNQENVKIALEAVQPASELIANMSTAIVNLASGLIADNWNPKTGKPTHYRQLTPVDYTSAGIVIGTILTTMSNSIINAVMDPNTKQIKDIFNGDTFKKAVEAISGTTDFIAGMVDCIIKLGSAQIPTKWDKDGKPIWYNKIDIKTARENLKTTIDDILTATIDAVLEVYEGDGIQNKGIKEIIGEDKETSKFLMAVEGINGITKTVANITDTVIKLGSAIIPDVTAPYKDGKPTKYKHISVENTIKDIKKIFKGDNTDDGLLNVLCNIINDVATTYFEDNDITPKIIKVAGGIGKVTKLISDITDMVINVANMKIPTGFKEDGSAQNYKKFEAKDIETLKTNVETILTSFISIFDTSQMKEDSSLKKYLTQSDIVKTDIIISNMNAVANVINNLINQVSTIAQYEEKIDKLFGTKSYGAKVSDKRITIGLFKAVFSIIDNFAGINELLSTTTIEKNIDNNNTDKLTGSMDSINMIVNEIVSKSTELTAQINEISTIAKQVKDNKIATAVNDIIGAYQSISNALKQQVANEDALNILKGITEKNDATLVNKENINEHATNLFKTVADDMSYFITTAIEPFDENIQTQSDALYDSIDKIHNVLLKQKDNTKAFKNNTNALGEYITTINTINLSKLQPLTTLVVELNKLSNKLGGLDNLTKVISDQLAVVLHDLVDSLTEAKTTINNAHELQADRHDKINKAIDNVKKLLDMPLQINVQANNGGDGLMLPSGNNDDESNNNNSNSSSITNNGSGDGKQGDKGGKKTELPSRKKK